MSSNERSIARRIFFGSSDGRLRATLRVVLSFTVFLGTLTTASKLLGRVPFPEVLVNADNTLAIFLAVIVLLVVGTRFVARRSLDGYGLALDRQWWLDSGAGLIAGFVFQGLVTALLFAFGAGRLVGTLSPGIGTNAITVAIALAAAVGTMVAVALWEELLFRGILIQNMVEGLTARGVDQRTAVGIALVGSALVFGFLHITAVAQGASVGWAVFQAVIAGLYFGLAYVLTDSLAFPIALHFSTNFWVVSVFGQPDSAFPALLRLERELQADPAGILAGLVPTVVLVGLVLGWVSFTRDDLSVPDTLSFPPRDIPDEAAGD